MTRIRFIVTPTGDARCIAGHLPDDMRAKLGDVKSTRRCSHVETWKDLSARACFHLVVMRKVPVFLIFPFFFPDPDYNKWLNYWWADMTPVRGPVLGPFDDREDALAAEVEYLYDNHLPEPDENHATD